ncbi:MAG: XdhC family protein, partial [Anaerolineales bacterium]|nr:XdhC family protein [Anaerolineales bacterium]
RWRNEGKPIALATVIQTWGSSPRRAGSRMGISLDGRMTGSVSGGCVENAVVEAGIESLKSKRPQLLHFGVADETAWEVGLACGGSIDIFVQPLDSKFFEELSALISADRAAGIVTVTRGPDDLIGREILVNEESRAHGSFGNEWDDLVLKVAQEIFSQRTPRRMMLNEEVEVFVDVILPSPTLIVVGGVHIAMALVSLAKTLGYRTVVMDPRRAWGSEERFPNVDQLIQTRLPEAFEQVRVTRSTAVATLTHDPKLDDPALKYALSSPAFYVGALGSKTTHAKRRERLLNDGVSEAQLSRLHAPIGLDIGAETPEEIALAVMSEVVKSFRKQNQFEGKEEAKLFQSPVSNL